MRPRSLFGQHHVLTAAVRRRLAECRRIVLLLDFDGTLAPIRNLPAQAEMPAKTAVLLRQLANRPNITVGLVTGRSRQDILKKVRMPALLLITNHGFEISWGQLRWIHQGAQKARPLLKTLARRLTTTLGDIPGILIEDKQYSLSVHYRNVPVVYIPSVRETVLQLLNQCDGNLRLTHGKKVLELRPRALWNKGYAVKRVLASLPQARSTLVIYAGDDVTDEDVFTVLGRRHVTITVGRRQSAGASYRARNPQEITQLMEIINSLVIESRQR